MILVSLVGFAAASQSLEARLNTAVNALEKDAQFKHATIGFSVVESKTGKPVFEKNPQTGLAPASCQKVITSVSAFELLGKDYRYRTTLAYDGKIENKNLYGNLYIIASGDPTLGSWRWTHTGIGPFEEFFIGTLRKAGIDTINGNIIIDDSKWESQSTPKGWTWDDIGNYYGAGARGLNWHENQYDMILRPGKKPGDSVEITTTDPKLLIFSLVNELRTGAVGSGDQSIIYLPEDGFIAYVRGTVPAGKETFTISGSMPNAANVFATELGNIIDSSRIAVYGRVKTSAYMVMNKEKLSYQPIKLTEITSPQLDSINYWFLKKSVNLYGEALVKTIAYEKKKFGATDSGLSLIRDFWAARGIEPSALKMLDGSGLSPANRVTTEALVSVLQYARQQSWFPSFYHALPETNGMKMKDGYIGGVRSYTGYVKSRSGNRIQFFIHRQ
ncbi:MAG: D-alanyl-D-alanine carboxypeptidase/D-alanyl-D-alanine-endopeptidase [Chitinophagaceae bacterium]|nr:D-alanyl-D-alanine carboxypeptidase/D-alanyl-D-alanine-endopeptidase [Chitinophagaceae bacterium]